MVKLSSVKLNTELVTGGVWFEYYAPGVDEDKPIR